MRALNCLIFLFISNALCASESAVPLQIEAAPATAIITAVPAGRRLINLPEVTYELAITLQCASPMQAESVSISVADTQTVLNAAEIGVRTNIATRITIPQQQNSPLAILDHCLDEATQESSTEPVLVRGAFTVQGSLRCSDGNVRSIHYAAQSLDLTLECAEPVDDAPPEPQD